MHYLVYSGAGLQRPHLISYNTFSRPFAIIRLEFPYDIVNPTTVCHWFTFCCLFLRHLQKSSTLDRLAGSCTDWCLSPGLVAKREYCLHVTNQTGLEISLPDFLPLTLSLISFTLSSLW